MLTVGYDATPLLGQRTGVGRYTEHLLEELATRDGVEMRPTAFTLRGRDQLGAVVPAGVQTRSRPIPANLLQRLWMHVDVPTVELLCGRADIFHATNFVLPPLHRARGVLTIHDLAYLRLPDVVASVTNRLETLVPRGLKRAAIVLTPSQATADDVIEAYGFSPDRIVVTPLGITPDWYSATPPTGPELARFGLPERYLLAVGTQEPRKGLQTLLDALRTLPDAPPLALVGAGGWGPALDRAGLSSDRVIELGYLDTAELQRVTAGAELLVYPSRYEGFGLPPLEAMATGRPVVVSDLAVLREACGEHARYAAVDDREALASAIESTLGDGGPTSAEARIAHAHGFTWQRCASLTAAAYARAAA